MPRVAPITSVSSDRSVNIFTIPSLSSIALTNYEIFVSKHNALSQDGSITYVRVLIWIAAVNERSAMTEPTLRLRLRVESTINHAT